MVNNIIKSSYYLKKRSRLLMNDDNQKIN